MLGDLYIFKNETERPSVPFDASEWYDVYEQWGVSFEDGALDVLDSFRPNKEPIVNKNVTAHGASYVTGAGLVDERTINLPFHIVADGKADLIQKRNAFYETIKSGLIILHTERPEVATYQFYYLNCNQFAQNLDGIAKFMLTMYETNRYDDDGDGKQVLPMPENEDMETYIYDLMQKYGGLASYDDVRAIVNNYDYSKI